MATPAIQTVREHIAWSYANLARAHAALKDGRTRYVQLDHIIRARLFAGLRSGRMSIGSLFDDERDKALADRACAYCGALERLTLDHLIPRIRGGGDDGTNLVIACRGCNSSKGGLDLLDWDGRTHGFPPLMLLRRYLKLVAGWCERDELLDTSLDIAHARPLPFALGGLPHVFPPLAELRL